MDIQEINKIFTTDFNLDGIACPHRNWDTDSRYNYIDNPRRRNGLMLVTDHPVLFNMADGSALRATAGDLILLPKGTRYTVQFLVPPEEQTHPVVLNFRLTAADGPEIFMGSQVIRLCRDDGSLLPLFKSVTKLYENGTTANLKAKVYELFGQLFPVHETDQCCINYINRHYTYRFKIPELAKRCTMSESAYRKQFKLLTGKTPVEYINALKIEKACQLLFNDDMSLQDISDFLGFYSLPYFFKVFKEQTGLTPKQYADQD